MWWWVRLLIKVGCLMIEGLNKKIKLNEMITLQYFDGNEWVNVGNWHHEWMAWDSLGGDDFNYRTLDESGMVLTDRSDF
jgi:hypothetical protein